MMTKCDDLHFLSSVATSLEFISQLVLIPGLVGAMRHLFATRVKSSLKEIVIMDSLIVMVYPHAP